MTTPSGDVAMPFGRYRGRAIADLPHKVLTRLLRAGVGSRLREAVLREVNQRKLDVLHLTALHEASHVVVASLLRVRHGHISIRGARTGKGRSGYMRGLATRSLLVRTRSRHAQIFALKGARISLAPSVLVKVRPTSMLTAAPDCITDLRNAHEDLCRVGLSNNDMTNGFRLRSSRTPGTFRTIS